MGFIVLLVTLWIPCALFSGVIAEDKGRRGSAWFLAGLLFGPVGLLAVAALSDRKQRRYLRLLVEHKGIDLTEATKLKRLQAFMKIRVKRLSRKS